jgi:hypothetical protein
LAFPPGGEVVAWVLPSADGTAVTVAVNVAGWPYVVGLMPVFAMLVVVASGATVWTVLFELGA